ncbi:MAG: NAD-dependent protein deacetylase [Pseudomonadota bacterium]
MHPIDGRFTYHVSMKSLQTEAAGLAKFIEQYPNLVVLTGAGISLDSGIPVYRDEAGVWQPGEPIKHQSFLQDERARQRYWSRSWYGWPRIRDAQPNAAHRRLVTLEQRGVVAQLITQNVDGLHQRAGHQRVIDLHGRVDQVKCLQCPATYTRQAVQHMLDEANNWPDMVPETLRPDGDMAIAPSLVDGITLPRCEVCGGHLMPHVVFFGGSVPRERVLRCKAAVEEADALLVVGSSLMVFSGFRLCRQAAKADKPIGIINPGVTRADGLASHRFYSAAGPLLTQALVGD